MLIAVPGIQPNIFLSYSHADKVKVAEIRQILESHDINVAWDEEFTLGKQWSDEMKQKLNKADCVVICWSQSSADSHAVSYELGVADSQNKLVGIVLEKNIEFKGAAGSLHHERLYEWSDVNREKRIKAVVDRIRTIASYRNPKISMEEILAFVRRVDRVPQVRPLLHTLEDRLAASQPVCTWMVSANSYDRAEEFATRAANQLIPAKLKEMSVFSSENDQSYEQELIELKWPSGYRDVDEAMEFIVRKLRKFVVGDEEDQEFGLKECIEETNSIAPTLYLILPLDQWRPTDKDVLSRLLRDIGRLSFDPPNQKYVTVLIAAEFVTEKQRIVESAQGGIFARLFKGGEDIDDVFGALAKDAGCATVLPTLTKIERTHVKNWCDEVDEEIGIPKDKKDYFLSKANDPFISRGSEEEHYLVMSVAMQKAMQSVFLGKDED